MVEKLSPIVSHHHHHILTQRDKKTNATSQKKTEQVLHNHKKSYDAHPRDNNSPVAAEAGYIPCLRRTTAKGVTPWPLSVYCVECSIPILSYQIYWGYTNLTKQDKLNQNIRLI